MKLPIDGTLRPADLIISGLISSTLNVDVTIRHHLAAFDNPTEERISCAAALKHQSYNALCRHAQLTFFVFGMSTLVGATEEAMELLSFVQERLIQIHWKAEGAVLSGKQPSESPLSACEGLEPS